MRIDLYEKLHEKHKEILKGYYGRGCSIACDDGWFDLIDKLCTDVMPLMVEIDAVVVDIKEKYGGLRFYISSGSDEIFDYISVAEEESYNICEVCGKPGETREDHSWLRTLCHTHYMEWIKDD